MPLIVLEGSDGTTKETQLRLLTALLEGKGYTVKNFDFPQYSKLSSGPVQEYLNDNYDTNPRQASVLFAVDRFDVSFKIREYLEKGYWVVTNRYVGSNMAHQGGRFKDDKEREEFFKWLLDFEYGLMGIPKPDLSIVLFLPLEECQRLISLKQQRDYIKNGENKDLHEKNPKHLRNAIKVYKQMISFADFTGIDIADENGVVLPRDDITKLIYSVIQQKIKVA